VLYEPQYYGKLLDSLVAVCRLGGGRTVQGTWGAVPSTDGPAAADSCGGSGGGGGTGAEASSTGSGPAGDNGGEAAHGGPPGDLAAGASRLPERPCASGSGGASGGTAATADGGAAGSQGSAGSPGADAAGGPLRTLPLCFVCYRRRRYKEAGFEAMALGRGFSAVMEVPPAQLHPDYREGYRLVELVHDGRLLARNGGDDGSGGSGDGGAAERREGPPPDSTV
jgi:hypothetical protein